MEFSSAFTEGGNSGCGAFFDGTAHSRQVDEYDDGDEGGEYELRSDDESGVSPQTQELLMEAASMDLNEAAMRTLEDLVDGWTGCRHMGSGGPGASWRAAAHLGGLHSTQPHRARQTLGAPGGSWRAAHLGGPHRAQPNRARLMI
jgi:hypothetical protein